LIIAKNIIKKPYIRGKISTLMNYNNKEVYAYQKLSREEAEIVLEEAAYCDEDDADSN